MDLQSLTIRLEEMRIKRRDSEQWMHHLLLAQDPTRFAGLTHLDLFCAKITDNGTNYLRNLQNLRSLEICGRCEKHKDLRSLVLLNLSQNSHLTDKSLEFISEADAVILMKRIRKFSMAQDIVVRAAVHIFNRISFAIAKGVEAQIVSRLPSNLL
ncbi:F-box/LRR-repeat protein 14-like protein isoform X1 [Tanacetum coccineum]